MSLIGNALVVGANKGIGLGFIKSLVNEEQVINLIATYRSTNTSLELLSLEKSGIKNYCIRYCRKNHIPTIQKTVAQMLIDYLIVNSSVFGKQENRLDEITYDNLYNVFLANTMGHILLIQSLIKNALLSDKKVIMSISSISASVASYATSRIYVYKSSKAVLHSLLKNVSLEFKKKDWRF